MWYTNMYSNIKVYQKYLVTSIKLGCATRSLYASSGSKAEGVTTNNQRGRGSNDRYLFQLVRPHQPFKRLLVIVLFYSCNNRLITIDYASNFLLVHIIIWYSRGQMYFTHFQVSLEYSHIQTVLCLSRR